MADLRAQEIFRAGTWNGMTFSEADLDGMVKAFDGLNLAGKVPLKFGHDSAKPVKDGKPALGWVSRLYREGRRLLADFSNVPDAVMSAIREKLYKHVSIELLQNVKAGTREIPWVPDAVALLGADQPAVGILRELEALTMSARSALQFDARVAFTRDFKPTGEKADMSEAEIAELKRRLAEAEANAATFKSNADKVTAERESEKRKNHVEKLKGIVQTAINAKRVGAATMTSFSKYAGADDSESIMRFSAQDIEGWLKTCAPTDKMMQDTGRKVQTRVEQREPDDDVPGDDAGQTNSMRFKAGVDHVREEFKFSVADMRDATKHLAVLEEVKRRYPDLWQAHAAEPWA